MLRYTKWEQVFDSYQRCDCPVTPKLSVKQRLAMAILVVVISLLHGYLRLSSYWYLVKGLLRLDLFNSWETVCNLYVENIVQHLIDRKSSWTCEWRHNGGRSIISKTTVLQRIRLHLFLTSIDWNPIGGYCFTCHDFINSTFYWFILICG